MRLAGDEDLLLHRLERTGEWAGSLTGLRVMKNTVFCKQRFEELKMIRSIILSMVLLFAVQTPALAFEASSNTTLAPKGGWLSFMASLFTLVGRIVEKAPIPHGPGAGVVLEVAQVVLKFVDKVIEEHKIPTTPEPPPGSTEPKTPTYEKELPPLASFTHLTSPSTELDALYGSANRFIDTANVLFDADRNGASTNELAGYVRNLQSDLGSVRDAYQDLGISYVIRPSDIVSVQLEIATNGLPLSEISFLTQSGFSASDIQDFTDHMVSNEIGISRDLDVLEIYDAGVQQLTVVPEPASMTLWATIGAGVVLWRKQRARARRGNV